MLGTVKLVNSKKTRAGVWIEGFGFSVLQGDELPLDIGHQIRGELRSLGGESLENLTTQETFEAFIDDYDQDVSEIRNSVFHVR